MLIGVAGRDTSERAEAGDRVQVWLARSHGRLSVSSLVTWFRVAINLSLGGVETGQSFISAWEKTPWNQN